MTSIICSLYKSDRYLKRFAKTLGSFAQGLKQSGVSFEIIVIANDPSKAEKELLEKYASQVWFKFVSVPRESLYASWNRGIEMAKGNIIGFWNADDIRYYKAIKEGEELILKGFDLVYFPFKIQKQLRVGNFFIPLLSREIRKQLPEFTSQNCEEFCRSMLCGPFFVFSKSLYEKVGPFDEQFKIAGDFDWCARAAHKTQKFVKAESIAGEFRVDGGGLSTGSNPRRSAENNIVYIRNHAWNKIVVAEDLIIKEYRPKYLSFKGRFQLLASKNDNGTT